MRLNLNSLSGVLLLALSTTAVAQAQKAKPAQPAKPAIPATPSVSTQPTTTMPNEPGIPQSTAPGQTETTPGQLQTNPGDASQLTPAQTNQTPSGQSVPSEASDKPAVSVVTKADVKAGASVYDQNGDVVGKIESISAKGAVISTGTVKATVPLSSFAKSDKGLVVGMSKAEIDAAAKPTAKKPK
jgi:hypothetical protein